MVRFLPFLISLVLSVYALFSCIQTRDEDVPHLPKLVWIVLIVFVPFAGPITWLLMVRVHAARRARATRPRKPSSRPPAPDDDPDFLASLDRYRDPRTTSKPPAGEKPAAEEPTKPPQDEATESGATQSEADPEDKNKP